MPSQAQCPTCGAPIAFRPGTMVVVCGYCRSLSARTDRDPRLIGKVADLVDTGSPLRVGLEGSYAGRKFSLVGRTQLRHPLGGVWDEWYLALEDGRWLGYVDATHQSLRDHGPTVWTYYHALAGGDVRADWEFLQTVTWGDCVRHILEELGKAHPDLERWVSRIDVMRWGHAMVRPRPGFMWSGVLERAREPFRHIHFAHSDLSGFALFEEAQDHGLRAAEEVLTALGRPVATWR